MKNSESAGHKQTQTDGDKAKQKMGKKKIAGDIKICQR